MKTSAPNSKTPTGPLTPTLAANWRTPNRQSPQTPRLATSALGSRGKVIPSVSATQPSASVTAHECISPLRTRTTTSSPDGSIISGTGRSDKKSKTADGREGGLSTPIAKAAPTASTTAATILNGNVTPRSATRKSKTGSNRSTPCSTPPIAGTSLPEGSVLARGQNAENTYTHLHEGKAKSIVDGDVGSKVGVRAQRPKLQLASSLSNSTLPATKSFSATSDSTKFFHASDATKGQTSHAGHGRPTLKKAATFFYANGQQESRDLGKRKHAASPTLSAVERIAPAPSDFCYADETKSVRSLVSPPPSLTSSPASSAVLSPTQLFPSLRPPSPLKENIHLSYRKGVSQVIRPSCHRLSAASLPAFVNRSTPQSVALGENSPNDETELKRRMSSPGSPSVQRTGHAKVASMSSIGTNTPTKDTISKEIRDSVSSTQSPITPNASKDDCRESTSLHVSGHLPHSPCIPTPTPISRPGQPDEVQISSPTITTTVPNSSIADLAANARRERKVLDLEISNSSLLAINRQLEREVRKQKTELRRFRRLSRAGHLSLGRSVSSAMNNDRRCVSCSTAATDLGEAIDHVGGNGDFLNGFDGFDDSEDDEDDTLSLSDLSCSSTSVSPAMASRSGGAKGAGLLMRDERRLRLDLSKHKELLVDSQRMNQSLRRCLDWTEELVMSGRKALEYRVRVSDVKLGGRVLSSHEHDEEGGVDDYDEDMHDLIRDGVPDEGNDGNGDDDGYNDVSASDCGAKTGVLLGAEKVNCPAEEDGVPAGGPPLSPQLSGAGSVHATHVAQLLPASLDYFGTEATGTISV